MKAKIGSEVDSEGLELYIKFPEAGRANPRKTTRLCLVTGQTGRSFSGASIR